MPLRNLVPAEAPIALPPSRLTRDDWIAICGEEFVDWMELTPEQRWVESLKLWATFLALGGQVDDDMPPPAGFRVRRLGVWPLIPRLRSGRDPLR